MIAIVSAIRLPGMSAPTACRLKYDGSWMRSRNGWSEPSLMRVAGVLAARALDGDERATGWNADEARDLGHDRAVGHLVQHLVDDPDALADLVDVEQVARVRIALGARRDVEVELRIDAVRMRAAHVVRHAGRAQRCGPLTHSRSAVSRSSTPRPTVRRTKISFSLSRRVCLLELDRRRGSSNRRGATGSRGSGRG